MSLVLIFRTADVSRRRGGGRLFLLKGLKPKFIHVKFPENTTFLLESMKEWNLPSARPQLP